MITLTGEHFFQAGQTIAGFRLVEWFPIRLTGDDIHERESHVARRIRDALAHQARTRSDPAGTELEAG